MVKRPLLTPGLHPCPAHEDRSPSLAVTQATDGRWLLHCHAGCTPEEILAAAEMTWGDLFPDPPTGRRELTAARQTLAAGVGLGMEKLVAEMARARARRAPWLIHWEAASRLRRLERLADRARALAARRPVDDDSAWALLALAAAVELEVARTEDV
jgi:hypothetical protein